MNTGIVVPAVSQRPFAGYGLVEFLVALLIFTASASALLMAQLNGQRLHDAAEQHSQAVALAADMFERIAANSSALASYQMAFIGAGPIEPPQVDCAHAVCAPAEMAAYDLWDWQSLLRGEQVRLGNEPVPGINAARLCLHTSDGVVTVTFLWRDGPPSATPALPGCDAASDAYWPPEEDTGEPGERRYRRLVLTSYVGQSA
jgi:type IV pilus assembly protein PilV